MLMERGSQSLQTVMNGFGKNAEGKSILLHSDQELAEDAIKSLLILERVRDGLPEGDYPLKELWTDPYFASKKDELRGKFNRWAGDN